MKNIISFSLIILLVGYNCNESKYIDDDFLQDLSSEDNRMWGELYLDVFNGDFTHLTYDYYIKYLDSTQHSSAEGIVDKIEGADLKLLKVGNETFWLFLYYKNQDLIIADNTSTDIGTVDTIINYSNDNVLPDLNSYASKIVK